MVLREVPIQVSADDQHLVDNAPSFFSPVSRSIIFDPSLIDCCECCNFSLDNDKNYSKTAFLSCWDDRNIPVDFFDNMKTQDEDLWPTNDQDIIRYLIDQQKFNGSWDLDSSTIERLTGNPLTVFQNMTSNDVLISAVVIVVLETRFATLSNMWHGIVQKARNYIIDQLGNNKKKLDILSDDIRKEL